MSKRRKKRLTKKKEALKKANKAISVGGHAHAVEGSIGFGTSLEAYIYNRIAKPHVKWDWVATALAVAAIIVSVSAGYFRSTPLFGGQIETIKWAAQHGDYTLADRLVKSQDLGTQNSILGTGTDLEELVYPERIIEREIGIQEKRLELYPGHRDLLMAIALLYRELGNQDKFDELWEQARILDPNNIRFSY